MKRCLILFLFFSGLCSLLPLFGSSPYPMIRLRTAYKDELFKQHQDETESWYFNEARGKLLPPLNMYSYLSKRGESLITLSASFNLPVDTLASINGLENMADFKEGQLLLIPSAPGLYLHKDSTTSWMKSLRSSLQDQEALTLTLTIEGRKAKIDYYASARFPSDHKRRFVLPLFLSPLGRREITSPYGFRHHPVTGIWGLHKGTDYRVPVGSPVLSCADGVVLSAGELEDYGKFIIIQHRNGYTSLYSHLNTILVDEKQQVLEGAVIAESGNTGISTGPHLHFEIRQNGKSLDPENLLIKEAE